MSLSSPCSSLLNRMCKDVSLLMYSRFLGSPATLVMKRNSETKRNTTNITSQDLKIKGKKLGTLNPPSSKT